MVMQLSTDTEHHMAELLVNFIFTNADPQAVSQILYDGHTVTTGHLQ